MVELGYDSADTSTSYELGSPSALGNYIADCYLAYGLSDGANEANAYASIDYTPFNPPIEVEKPGNPDIIIQHMQGSGGVKAANYVYNIAPKDGSVMGIFANTVQSTDRGGEARQPRHHRPESMAADFIDRVDRPVG